MLLFSRRELKKISMTYFPEAAVDSDLNKG
jgi:hypothetical protein